MKLSFISYLCFIINPIYFGNNLIVYYTYAILVHGVNTHANGFNWQVLFENIRQFPVKDELGGGKENL
jgi:hypothetical protein